MKRVIAYIDGYNLYYGLRSKGWKRYYWLNIQAMAKFLLKPNQILEKTKFFTTIVERPTDRHRRQAAFWKHYKLCRILNFFMVIFYQIRLFVEIVGIAI